MGFLYGAIMFFICHTVANMFANNIYFYIMEEKNEDPNKHALKQFLIKSIISFAAYISVFIIALTVKIFSEHNAAILIGNGIGFITAFIQFRLTADKNYIKQKAKIEWDSWNYMSFEEKYETIKKRRDNAAKSIGSETTPTNQAKISSQLINQEEGNNFPTQSQNYIETISEYFKAQKMKTTIGTTPDNEKFIIVNYQTNYFWSLHIKVDEDNETIKIYAPFFSVSPTKKNHVYELINDWNREFLFVKFYFEDTTIGQLVVASNDIPTSNMDSVGALVFKIANDFIKALDLQFAKIPRYIIAL